MGKHAYLILAHKNPEQIAKLLESLDDERNDIYLHIDRKAPFGYERFRNICRHSTVTPIEPRIPVTWGGVSIITVEMALLKEACRTRHDYYHLLSGMDLPIKSQNRIHNFFDANSGREFINLWEMSEHTLRRVHYYTLFPEGSHFFLTNLLNHAVKGILSALGIRMNKNVEFRKGSQWFSITHELAEYVVSQEEWAMNVFRHSTLCDEFFIPTIVWRSEFKDKLYSMDKVDNHTINDSNMRYIDWNRGPSIRHPWTFTAADFDTLASVPHLWARKFDETVDSEIIDRVCKELAKPDCGNAQES